MTNMILSPRAQRLLVALGPDEAFKRMDKQLEPEHVLLALARSGDGLGYLTLKALKINILTFQLAIEQHLSADANRMEMYTLENSPRLNSVIDSASMEAKILHCDYIGTEHLLLACIKESKSLCSQYFFKAEITIEQARTCVSEVERKVPSSAKIHDAEGGSRDGQPYMSDGSSQRKDKEANSFLAQFSHDLTQDFFDKQADPVVGRQKEIMRLIQVLSRRTKNNPVLVGEPGVGKTAIVEGLAQYIARGDVPKDLLKKRILSLDLAAMIAGTKYRGEFEERMKRLMKEVKESKNLILFIDELHTLIGAGGPEGSMDASNMLKPALSRGEIQVIGATTTKEYRKYIEKDSALARRFQQIKVEEPSSKDTEEILKGLKKNYEDFHRVIYDEGVIEAIVKYSMRYIPERFLPDKAIDIMDEAGAAKKIQETQKPAEFDELQKSIDSLSEEKCLLVQQQNYEKAAMVRDRVQELRRRLDEFNLSWKNRENGIRQHVAVEDVSSIISSMTGIPADNLDSGETKRLLQMEKYLHEDVVGQEEAISLISSAVRRSRAGVSSLKRPLGSFIFLGPTGVGKTQLAKALAKFLFGTEDSLIRVDMSDYMEKHNASRLVGAPPGYIGFDEGGILTEKVRQHPYSVVLLDEIEKAHPDIFNLLLQMLEEGELKDNLGHTVSFKNTMVIMTSNAGARQITSESRLGFSNLNDGLLPYDDIKSSAMEELKRIMSPELLNRIDDVIVFNALNKDQVSKILDIQLKELESRLAEKGLSIVLKPRARSFMIDNGYEPSMGARPMRRLIQRNIEDQLANLLLSGKRGLSNQVIIDMDAEGKSIIVKFKKVRHALETPLLITQDR
ncbi:MAG: ATP-dependent Clp protease ATP-binding subunit [Treponema sp.]|nr:ATP-dependent Clp protease ATP-binding subunit [Treponema sp.]